MNPHLDATPAAHAAKKQVPISKLMNHWKSILVFHTGRLLERLLPPFWLRAILFPWLAILAITASSKLGGSNLPSSLPSHVRRRPFIQNWLWRFLRLFPDRFASRKWLRRCRCEGNGLQCLQVAAAEGKPVVLAGLHFGPMFSQRDWMRAFGYPVTTLTGQGVLENRSPIKIRTDALTDDPEIPHRVSNTNIREAVKLIKGGGWIHIPMDLPKGRLVEVETPWGRAKLASSAIRLASAFNAELVPCLIAETGPWEFMIWCGQPISNNGPATKLDLQEKGQMVMDQLIPILRQFPEQWGPEWKETLRPETPSLPT